MNFVTANVLKSIVTRTAGTAISYGSGLGYGCMGITSFYGDSMDDNDAIDLLQVVYDNGARHFDTAEVYQQNDKYNESIIGTFFKERNIPRDSYTIATKYWPAGTEHDYEYDTVKERLLLSLQRLQLDYVDLYYAHRVMSLEGGKTFAKTAQRLKEEGLIKTIGLSEVSGKWLEEIYSVYPIDAIQQEWSLMTRSLETELLPVCKKLNVVVVAYSPLARNLLAKKIETTPNDFRARNPRHSQESLDANQSLIDTVRTVGLKYNCTIAEISLAWIFNKAIKDIGVTVIPIPGSTNISNVNANNNSVTIDISTDDMLVLDSLASKVVGERGNEWYMSMSIENQK